MKFRYVDAVTQNLKIASEKNQGVLERLVHRLVQDVRTDRKLWAFGSGHSALFPQELYHRAGGASFLIPVVADFLMPSAGPPIAGLMERTPLVANAILARHEPQAGEMIWIMSQSGVNAAVVDLALYAKSLGLSTVAWTSVPHSQAVSSRHSSSKRLFEVCDETVDLVGFRGDASIEIQPGLRAGPLSLVTAVTLGHSCLVEACALLEAQGVRVTYTSVNTPEGESRNLEIERQASKRDPRLIRA
jgi:uncharacterized phosphosugar-binding protein